MSTGFLTNSPCVAKQLERRCPNRPGVKKHDHVRLENGRARKAQEYPDGLCKAICRGIKEQLEADRIGQFLLMTMGNGSEAELRGAREEIKRLENKYRTGKAISVQKWKQPGTTCQEQHWILNVSNKPQRKKLNMYTRWGCIRKCQ